MAAAESPVEDATTIEPHREVCNCCQRPVLVATIRGVRVVADPHEWEPRASCYVCSTIKARGQRRTNCDRCGGCGYVGEKRPSDKMLAVDVAWSDESHIRVVGARTPRRRGEALYTIHICPSLDQSQNASPRRSTEPGPTSAGRGPAVETQRAMAA